MSERVLGLDWGAKRVGLALGVAGLATALAILENCPEEELVQKIRAFCQEEKISLLVVGLPLNTAGQEALSAESARRFGERLGQELGLPVKFWDETLTTVEALDTALEIGVSQKRRRQLDDKAAAIMLQEWLDAQG